jgi:NAD(P)-dependent dehydrogenase (short-subunit alcohol dehydrogenase family)
VARRLAAEGATVVLNDIDAALAGATAAEIEAGGGRAVVVVGDIRARATIDAVAEAGAGADVLVNNVGHYQPFRRRFLETTEDDWDALYAVNLEHVLRLTQALLPAMIDRGSGSVVNVSTVESLRGIPAHAVYSAFNAGVNAFTRSLAVEVGRHGVRVNAIAPDMGNTLQTTRESKLRGRDPRLIESWVPLARFGEPDDFAGVVLFLASDLSRFVTGQVIPVDGGTLVAGGIMRRSDGEDGWTNKPDRP